MFLPLLPFVFIVVSHRPTAAAGVAAFEYSDLLFDELRLVLTFGSGNRIFQPVVLDSPRGHICGGWAIVVTGLPVDALAFVAPVVYALVPAAFLELRVDEGSPPFPRVFHPRAAVKRAALRGAATCGIVTIRPAKPRLPHAIDTVVLALRNHQVCMGLCSCLSSSRPAWMASVYGSRSSSVMPCAKA